MGSGRVELKLIKNECNRKVTFCIRRNKLLKKAYELSVLCDAEVGLIIFSPRGRLYEFSSNSCMTKTLERYKEHCEPEPAKIILEEPLKSAQDLVDLKAHVEAFQRFISNLMAEDMRILSSADLKILESQLESSLKHIRDTKEQNGDMIGRLSLLALEEGQGSGGALEMEPNSSYARL